MDLVKQTVLEGGRCKQENGGSFSGRFSYGVQHKECMCCTENDSDPESEKMINRKDTFNIYKLNPDKLKELTKPQANVNKPGGSADRSQQETSAINKVLG